jgi:hypothetical protein
MSGFDLLDAIEAVKRAPRNELNRRKLDGALSNNPRNSFAAGFPVFHQDLARMIHHSAQRIIDNWEQEKARWQWIRITHELKRILEKPKKMPRQKKPAADGADLKKRAAGDDD